MSTLPAQLVTLLFSLLYFGAFALISFVFGDAIGPLHWLLSSPFLIVGLLNLLLVFRFGLEKVPADAEFHAYDPQRYAPIGSPAVLRIAQSLTQGLRQVPHRIFTSHDSVQIIEFMYDPRDNGANSAYRRITLTPILCKNALLRINQHPAGDGTWQAGNQAETRLASASIRMDLKDGIKTTTTTDTKTAIDHAIKQALQTANVKSAMPTMMLVGLVNAALGILVAIGAVVLALMFPTPS